MLCVLSACADPAAALSACAELAGPPDPVAFSLSFPNIGEGIEIKTARASGLLKLIVAALDEHADTIFLSLELTHDLN